MRILYLLFAFLCLMMPVAPAKLPYKGWSGGGSPKSPENAVVDANEEFIQALEEAAGPATDGAWGSKPLQAGPEPGNGGEDPGDDGSGTGGMEEVRRKCEEAGGYCAIELCHPGDKYIQICHRRRPCCRKVADALQV
ncbi:defensin-B5-like isoform X3 [Hemicordylus capensis]|uniref:defensin-B5-like isoform X3 n=1 Tax=Hemicordylus capensis TaxID=884348 RepID=UPI002304CCD3|nr:defensin-B5-like isoform X3 [Hemicordylus capensis]